MATDSIHKKLGEVQPRSVMQADRQTDTQTDRHTHHNSLEQSN